MRDLAIAQLAQVVAEDLDLAAAGLIHGGDQVQQSGLARSSGRAHRRDELALPDGDVSFSATTWNSSRRYSLERLRASIIVSVMIRPFGARGRHLSRCRRIDDKILSADESFFNTHSLRACRTGLDAAPHRAVLEHHEHTVVANCRGRHKDRWLRFCQQSVAISSVSVYGVSPKHACDRLRQLATKRD